MYDTNMNNKELSRKELIRQARRELTSRPETSFSLFKFHEPKPSSQEGLENDGIKTSAELRKNMTETRSNDYTDTLMPRIILTTALFLLLFFMSHFEIVPGFAEQLRTVISDNGVVEKIYDFAEHQES